MTIRLYGGVFGRNPKFRSVEVEEDLAIGGSLIVGGQTLTSLNYKGAWNALTNTPAIASGVGNTGEVYIVSVSGTTTIDGVSNWGVGDWLIFNGTTWQRIEGGANGNFVELTSSSTTILNGTTIPASKTLLVSTDIGSTVQGYDADTAKYDDTTANFTGTLQNGGSNVVVDTDIGSTVQAYDATILNDADIGVTVQGYDADTAKYDDTTANFTGTLQQGGSNVLKATDIGSSVQGYDADTAKLDNSQTWTAAQTFNENVVMALGKGIDFSANANAAGATSEILNDYEEGTWTATLKGSVSDPTTPVTATAQYTKIGNIVHIYFAFEAVDTTGASGNISVSGVPFNAKSGVRPVGVVGSFNTATFAADTYLVAAIALGGSILEIKTIASAGAWGDATHSVGTTRYLWAQVTYQV